MGSASNLLSGKLACFELGLELFERLLGVLSAGKLPIGKLREGLFLFLVLLLGLLLDSLLGLVRMDDEPPLLDISGSGGSPPGTCR